MSSRSIKSAIFLTLVQIEIEQTISHLLEPRRDLICTPTSHAEKSAAERSGPMCLTVAE